MSYLYSDLATIAYDTEVLSCSHSDAPLHKGRPPALPCKDVGE